MSFLILENKKIDYASLVDYEPAVGFSSYSLGILAFAKAWFTHQNLFTIQTSGSTGAPKTITWSRELILWSIENTAQALQLKKEMHVLHCIDANKTGGKMMLARAFELGMSMEVLVPSSNPFENAQSTHYDFASMVPMQIHYLLQHQQLNALNKIDTLLLGGAVLNPLLTQALQPLTTNIYFGYGMTETASHIALQRINGVHAKAYFTCLPSVEITLNDEACAVIHTPFHEALITHDRIAMQGENRFVVLGRTDNIVNSGGIKIELEKVEAAIDKALTNLKMNFYSYCAYHQPDDRLGEALMVIIESEPWDANTMDEFKNELKNHLEKVSIPQHIYFTTQLEFTSSGKIDRKGSAEKILKK